MLEPLQLQCPTNVALPSPSIFFSKRSLLLTLSNHQPFTTVDVNRSETILIRCTLYTLFFWQIDEMAKSLETHTHKWRSQGSTPVMASGLAILAFLPVEQRLMDCILYTTLTSKRFYYLLLQIQIQRSYDFISLRHKINFRFSKILLADFLSLSLIFFHSHYNIINGLKR